MSYGLRQLITEKTRVSHQSESTIDVILTSHPDMHKKSGIIKYTLSDHFLTYTEVQRHCPSKDTHKHNTVRFRDMKCFDQDKFLDDIKSNSCFSDNSFQRTPSWDEWKSTFLEISAKHAPFKTIRLKKRSNPWISADIIKLMYERDHVHKTATKNNDSALYGRYKRLRNQVTAMINANKKEYYKHVDALSKSDPKQMWGEIKQLVTNKPKHQQRLCNLTPQSFNKFFVQIGSSQVDSRGRMNANDIYWKGPKSMYTFRFKEITHVDIEQYFVSLSSKANNDLLDFDIRLIKYAAPFISESLSRIINDSLLQGRVDMDWKRARVSPVYKGEGDLDFEGNYRPISVIGHIARLVESLVCSQIIHYLESHDFISHDQSAYLKRHSTQTSLHRVIDDWLENINEGELTGACLLDISKCFDSINHDILLKKLEMYGFQDVELTWFKSYLYNRQQLVSFQQETSEHLDIKNGVPQGSVLGPILFLLFINDISNFTLEGCVLNMFADDVIIYASADNVELLKHKLETCMNSITRWYSNNCLSINKKKSNVMIIGSKFQLQYLQLDNFSMSLDSDKLELVERAKYLGLYVKNDLSWDEHILKTCQNMNYFIHVLRRLRRIFPKGLLLKVYKSYIQSKLEYGLTIWGCTTDTNLGKIQRIQSLAARIITGNFDYIHSRGVDIVRSLHLQTVKDRRDYFLCVLMFKCIHGLAPNYLRNDVTMYVDIHGYDTRSGENMDLYVPRVIKDIYKRSFSYMATNLWNQLPTDVKESATLDSFKQNYKYSKGWIK